MVKREEGKEYGVRSQKFIWASVYSCNHWLRHRLPSFPRIWAHIRRRLLVRQERRPPPEGGGGFCLCGQLRWGGGGVDSNKTTAKNSRPCIVTKYGFIASLHKDTLQFIILHLKNIVETSCITFFRTVTTDNYAAFRWLKCF
jgi:hypothetical protein